MNLESIARVCHEANRAYCASIGDTSQPDWENAPEWQKDSAIKGVEFCRLNPDAPASANHDAWLDVKRAEGWKYGPVKDADKKEHPCFVPYDELPIEQQRKDALFKAVVASLLDDETRSPELKTNRGFGDAIAALKQGKRVAREGWNGKGMFVFMQVPAVIATAVIPNMTSLPDAVKIEMAKRGESLRYSNQLALVKPDNAINGWAPSVADALADDWEILD